MGCETSRPARKMSFNKSILERQRALEKGAEKNPSVDGFVQSRQNRSKMVLEPSKLSGEQHKKPKSKADDQTRSPSYTKSEPQEITIDTKLNNVGLAGSCVQGEEQAKANGSVATSPGALDTSQGISNSVSITVNDSRSNVLFDSRNQDLGRATSCTIPGNSKNNNPVEEELKLAHKKLTRSETIISEKDKRIQELLEENRKLKKRKSYHRPSTSVPVFGNKTSSRFKDKIRDIKKAANFDTSAGWKGISQSCDREQLFKGTRVATNRENQRSETPDMAVVPPAVNSDSSLHSSFKDSTFLNTFGESGQLPDVPLKFGLTVEESRKRRQVSNEAAYKSNSEGGSGQWEYSEMLMIE